MSDLSPKHDSGIAVEIRANRRNRRMKLSFRPNRGFLLTHPPRTSKQKIQTFIKDQTEWMQKVLEQYASQQQPQTCLIEYLQNHPELTLNGIEKPVVFTATSGLLHETETTIEIFPGITEEQLVRQLKSLAKPNLSALLLKTANDLELHVNKVQIRDQHSRWGSCSTSGNISLNWRLILLPYKLQKHILLHELAHIPHPNHSSNFWNQLRLWDPECDQHHQQIKTQAHTWIKLGRN